MTAKQFLYVFIVLLLIIAFLVGITDVIFAILGFMFGGAFIILDRQEKIWVMRINTDVHERGNDD